MKTKQTEIQQITFIGMLINLILSILKSSVGYLYKSQSLFADGIHSLSDMATDIIIIVGAKFWEQPPDKSHPYGHGRIETLVTLTIGITLAVVAFGIGWKAINNFNENLTKPSFAVFIIAIISIFSKEILYQWTIKKGRKLKSSAIISNAWHHRSDALSSIPVAVAVIGSYFYPAILYLDSIAAILVSIMLLKAAYSIAKPGILEICETNAGLEIEELIKIKAKDIKEIKEIHAIRTRKLGAAIFADLHLLLDANTTVYDGHEVGMKLKRELLAENDSLIDVLIHIEPYEEKKNG